ncbi:MAG: tetratricopeptide repeat protein [Acidobacteriota bacterium]|nr:tetratricopeptide repeat protein [Acidobacteriota bacterium]
MAKPVPRQASGWTNTQVYTAIVAVLVLGALAGYLLHSSSSSPSSSPAPAATGASLPANSGLGQMPTGNPEVSALQARVQANPRDVSALTALGNAYFDASQWPDAISAYTRALNEAPANPDVRTDMGVAYFYTGDPDRALKEFDHALKDDPKHAQTLFNVGIVKMQGKHDPKGALAAWQQLLQIDPQYADRAKVEMLMTQAKAQVK